MAPPQGAAEWRGTIDPKVHSAEFDLSDNSDSWEEETKVTEIPSAASEPPPRVPASTLPTPRLPPSSRPPTPGQSARVPALPAPPSAPGPSSLPLPNFPAPSFASSSVAPLAPPVQTSLDPWKTPKVLLAVAAAGVAGVLVAVFLPSSRSSTASQGVATPAAPEEEHPVSAGAAPQSSEQHGVEPAATAGSATTPSAAAPQSARYAIANPRSAVGCEEIIANWNDPVVVSSPASQPHWTRARQALMRGDLEASKEHLCAAARLNPAGPATEKLATLFLMQGDVPKAKYWSDKLQELRPEERRTKELVADVYSFSGDEPNALVALLDSLSVKADDMETRRGVSRRYVFSAGTALTGQDLILAERLYRRALLLDPSNVAASVGVARVLLRSEQPQAAVIWAERAVELSPRSYAGHLALGDAQAALGKADTAKAAWLVARKFAPNPREVDARLSTPQ